MFLPAGAQVVWKSGPLKSVEAYNPHTKKICKLPDLPYAVYGHSHCGGLICSDKSCLKLGPMGFVKATVSNIQYFNERGKFSAGVNLTYPTNSFYPPGTLCAQEKNLRFCPSSGESGSPLMVEDDEGRFSAVGVNSFIKGCSVFQFIKKRPDRTILRQVSENPSVYSRLSCFLPWIAQKYGMSYTATEEDERCEEGTGDINEVGGDQCRTTPTDRRDRGNRKEALCLFPLYLDS